MPPPAPRIRLFHSWATLLFAAAALAIFALPQLSDTLLYRRAEIASGQLWRLWTGHLVHFGWQHLAGDLAVFLGAGLWLEALAPRTTRWLLLLAPAAISALLFVADPALTFYGGLSGVAVGVLVLLAFVQLHHDRTSPRWFWPAVLALVALKVGAEAVSDSPLVATFGRDIKVSTLAHLGGIACALLAWPFARSTPRTFPPKGGPR